VGRGRFRPFARGPRCHHTGGARLASSVSELAAQAGLVLVVVVDDEQVKSPLEGSEGLLATLPMGKVVAICSSVRPETCSQLAEKTSADGVYVIDCALTGGERGAEQGSLRLMCGGPERVIDACRIVFSAFATDVCHVGPVGAGQVAKTANNILLWACIRADVEVLRLASRFGVAPNKLRAFMAVGSGANRPLAEWGQHCPRWPQKDLEVALAMAD
jgi:3-hydroxyisobutyrate dehydrogenase-like beta-hydroxyacid dehydrogenase